MSEILAKPEDLREQSQNMSNRADAARSEFAQLRTRLQQINDQFRGSAAQAFDAQYQEWDRNANELVEALEGLGTWLSRAADTVEETDARLAQGLG